MAILSRVDVQVVPDEELAVEAAEHDSLLENVPHVEQLGDLDIALLESVFVAGLVELVFGPVELILDVLLHDGPLVFVLLGVSHGLLDVEHHGHLADLEQVLNVLLESLDRDLHVVARNGSAAVAPDLVPILQVAQGRNLLAHVFIQLSDVLAP